MFTVADDELERKINAGILSCDKCISDFQGRGVPTAALELPT